LNLEDLSVLLVEEDADLRARTREMLEALGVRELAAAGDTPAALDLLRQQSWDVLLCTHKLGIESGLLRGARQISPGTRAVLMAAYAPASRLVAQTLGATDVLQKPFSLALLELVLRRVAATFRGLRGEVQELSLTDILQMYHHGRQSIGIVLSGPISGRIRMLKGEIVHAESDTLTGSAALSRLLGAKTGVMSTELAPRDTDVTIHDSFQFVLLGAIAEYDEQRRNELYATGELPAPSETPVDVAPVAPRLPSLIGVGPDLLVAAPSARPERKRRRSWLFVLPLLAAAGVLVVYFGFLPEGLQRAASPPRSSVNKLTPTPAPMPLPAPAPDPEPPARSTPERFTLRLDSTPRDALVTENGAPLGRTPLTLELQRDTFARGPRRFVLQQAGYAPYVLEQSDSEVAVQAAIALEPLPAAARDVGSGSAAPAAPQPSAVQPPLDIRLQR
jgi:CheY-like chemotaxis protein